MSSNLVYKTIQIKEKKTISELLKELKLDDNYFAILVNNKHADINQTIFPEDKILILPKIKGGGT